MACGEEGQADTISTGQVHLFRLGAPGSLLCCVLQTLRKISGRMEAWLQVPTGRRGGVH